MFLNCTSLNRDLIAGDLSPRISSTNFYPWWRALQLRSRLDRMVHEHLQIPMSSEVNSCFHPLRSDPAYKDQEYWRGRIWGPMNYLVYLGLAERMLK